MGAVRAGWVGRGDLRVLSNLNNSVMLRFWMRAESREGAASSRSPEAPAFLFPAYKHLWHQCLEASPSQVKGTHHCHYFSLIATVWFSCCGCC